MGADKLNELVKKAEKSAEFSADEVETLKKMAEAWQGLEAFGRVAALAKTVLIYIGWLIGIYFSVKFVAAEWVKGIK